MVAGRRHPRNISETEIMNAHAEIFSPGTTVEWLQATYRILLTQAQTEGRLGIFEALIAPGFGPPRHIHHKEDETVFVAEGEALFWLDGQMFNRKAGDVVFVARGKEHTFKVTGLAPARFVTTVTPGGFEGFFPAVAKRGIRIPEDMAELFKIGARFNNEFTGPPLR